MAYIALPQCVCVCVCVCGNISSQLVQSRQQTDVSPRMLGLFPKKRSIEQRILVKTTQTPSELHKGKRIPRIHMPFLHLLFELIQVRRRAREALNNLDLGAVP